MIKALDFLYLVLAFGLIPVFVILAMILWRVYKMMDRIELLLGMTEQVIGFAKNIDRVPGMIATKIVNGFHNFLNK